jgi:hypothetical protein
LFGLLGFDELRLPFRIQVLQTDNGADNIHLFNEKLREWEDYHNFAVQQVCKEFKRLMLAYIEELAIEAEIPDAHRVAVAVAILLEGPIVTAQVTGTPECATIAREAAKTLIDSALKAR